MLDGWKWKKQMPVPQDWADECSWLAYLEDWACLVHHSLPSTLSTSLQHLAQSRCWKTFDEWMNMHGWPRCYLSTLWSSQVCHHCICQHCLAFPGFHRWFLWDQSTLTQIVCAPPRSMPLSLHPQETVFYRGSCRTVRDHGSRRHKFCVRSWFLSKEHVLLAMRIPNKTQNLYLVTSVKMIEIFVVHFL